MGMFTLKELIKSAEREGIFLREQSNSERSPESVERGDDPVRWIEVTKMLGREGYWMLRQLAENDGWDLYWEHEHWGDYSYDDWVEHKYFVQLPNHDRPEWIERNDLYKRIMGSF